MLLCFEDVDGVVPLITDNKLMIGYDVFLSLRIIAIAHIVLARVIHKELSELIVHFDREP